MHYTLHQLQIFRTIVEKGSITKAADKLHLTQPAVSIQLKKFQEQFEIALTEVVGRKVYVTEFGKKIAEVAARIVDEMGAINNLTQAYQGRLAGKLTVSTVSTGKYVMPYFLAQFMKEHPGIDLSMDVTNKQKVIESLEKNQVDFALVSILPENLRLQKMELLVNKLYLVGNRDEQIIQESEHLLNSIPLIFREQGSGTRQAMEKFFQKHKLSVQMKMELTTNEAVKQAVIAGLGYSIMPIIGIRNELQNNSIRVINAKGLPIKTMWQLTWLPGKNLSPVASAFLDHVKREKEKISQRFFPELDRIS